MRTIFRSALYRLRAQHERACRELDSEQDLEKVIAERLESEEWEDMFSSIIYHHGNTICEQVYHS